MGDQLFQSLAADGQFSGSRFDLRDGFAQLTDGLLGGVA